MKYFSTRGDKTAVSASEAIIRGIAPDGGLYVPEEIPQFGLTMAEIAGMDYQSLAYEVLKLYLTDFTKDELLYCVKNAYGNGFDDEKLAPVIEKNGVYFLELFHGRTLAFKDMALSILPHFLTVALKKQGIDKELLILTATSGDTGKAALAGFADVPGMRIVVFYPVGGVSEVQRLQMVTQEGGNTCVVGVRGNFDDTQNGVKQIFADSALIAELAEKGVQLSSANSINIGRLVPQIVYYFYAYAQLLKNGAIKDGEKINFVVPTGNFGNILAGYYAKKMGLPVDRLICASNSNKVLYDFFKTEKYDKKREFILTVSPSMDILISSNLERLLYDLSGKDSEKIAGLMEKLNADGSYEFNTDGSGIFAEFADENETFAAIKKIHGHGYVMDTHTAVAYAAYEKYLAQNSDGTKAVIVSTASPYKFGADVLKAITSQDYSDFTPAQLFAEINKTSGVEIPEAIVGLDEKEVLHKAVCDKNEMRKFAK